MGNDFKEQAIPGSAEGKPGGEKAGEDSFGKFKNKEGLLEAYGLLEAEFTRRSQRIKELEAELTKREKEEKWEKKVKKFTEEYPVAKDLSAEIGGYLEQKKELLEDENCLEKALLAVLTKKDIKKPEPPEASILKAALPEAPTGGEIPAALPKRPKTIAEAGELAVKFFNDFKL